MKVNMCLSGKWKIWEPPLTSLILIYLPRSISWQSPLDLYYQISIKGIDLKELSEFHVLGDKLEPPKPIKPRNKA